MHDDLRVVLTCQMMPAVRQEMVAERRVVGELPVECKAEPLVLPQMMPLERLSIALVISPTRGIPDVPDRGRPRILLHDGFGLGGMGELEYFAHRPYILVRVDQLVASRIKRGDSGRQLPAVLDIQQHAGQQPGHFRRMEFTAQRTGFPT